MSWEPIAEGIEAKFLSLRQTYPDGFIAVRVPKDTAEVDVVRLWEAIRAQGQERVLVIPEDMTLEVVGAHPLVTEIALRADVPEETVSRVLTALVEAMDDAD